jgi:hypothetical protein
MYEEVKNENPLYVAKHNTNDIVIESPLVESATICKDSCNVELNEEYNIDTIICEEFNNEQCIVEDEIIGECFGEAQQIFALSSQMILNDTAASLMNRMQLELEALGICDEGNMVKQTNTILQTIDAFLQCENVEEALMDCIHGFRREIMRVRNTAAYVTKNNDDEKRKMLAAKISKAMQLYDERKKTRERTQSMNGRNAILERIAKLRHVKRMSIDQSASIPVQVRAQMRWNKIRDAFRNNKYK